jgi:hypothetical protein
MYTHKLERFQKRIYFRLPSVGAVAQSTALMRVTNRLVDSVLTACESDAVVGTQFFRVTGLLDPPTRLLHPSFLCRVATVNLIRAQRHSRRRQVAVANVGDGGSGIPEMQWE